MRTRRFMRNSLAYLLACLLVLCNVPVAHAAEEVTTIDSETIVYWTFDQEVYENLFSSETSLSNENVYASQTLALQNPDTANSATSICASYTFDVDGSGSMDPITVTGQLDPYICSNEIIYSGIMNGDVSINGVLCGVSAVVDMNSEKNKVNAGITIIPNTACGIEDYVFFALGDPVITADMISDAALIEDTSAPTTEIPCSDTVYSTQALTYTSKTSASSSFSDSYSSLGTAQTINVKYCSSANRTCVSVTTNASALEQYFSYTGATTVTVDSLKIGLKMTNSNSVANIANIHSVLETDDDPVQADVDYYIDYLSSLLSDIFGIASSILVIFENMLNDLFDDNAISTNLYATGTHSYVEFDFPNSVTKIRDVQFDDSPMPVEFNLASTSTVTTGFQAYSNISYYVQCIEKTTASVVRLAVACDSVTTSTFYLTVSK